MSAVSLLSSLREKPSDGNPKDGLDHEGHDEDEMRGSMLGAGAGGDPAVLCIGPARKPLIYTVEELLRLRQSPLVKRNLENAFAGCEALALVLKRRSDSPNEDDRGARGDAPSENHKGVYGRGERAERRSADPRERVRKESESTAGGIVLSPQRRSFTLGCAAPAAPAAAPAHPPHDKHHSPQQNSKPEQGNAGRRIGSGRIMVRDTNQGWEEGEWNASESSRPQQRNNYDRFERRSYGRDSYSSDIKREREERFNNEKTRDRERFIPTSDEPASMHREESRRSGGRYSQRRFEKEDEPEWFSGGPTSKLETIELRGFDEPVKNNGAATNKETEKYNNDKGNKGRSSDETSHSPEPKPNDANTTATSKDKDKGVESKPQEQPKKNEHRDLYLDEIFKYESIPDVLTNGSGESGESTSKLFTQWFHRDSPTGDAKHYERLLHNIVDDLDNSTRLEAPTPAGAGAGGESQSHVFAPISPGGQPPSLLDLLRRANANAERAGNVSTPHYDHDLSMPHPHHAPHHGPNATMLNSVGGKIHSLEELEARLRAQPAQHTSDHDLSAFKRLLSQVSGGHVVSAGERQPQHMPQPQPQPQPMSLLQMLNKSMEAQQKAAAAPPPPHIPQDLLYKLIQVQQRQQQQQAQQQQQQQAAALAASEMSAPAMSPADAELLQRPEAQAIIHGLKAGEITVQHLMQQLGNPGLAARHRDLLLTILRLHHHQRQQMGGSPLPGAVGVGGVNPAHLVVPPHHQPLRLSPLPHPAFCVSPIMATSPNTLTVHHPGVPARIPSPRELAAHTQSIMQGALIKKKLEEQRENYRRRHEMHPKQQTPISFTPTSVLRKMTAEKDSEAQNPKQQWAQPIKMPQGRPIVKGNQSGAGPTIGYAGPTPNDYQQHYLNQQQQQLVGGVRQFPHPQQRQQIPTTFNNMNNMGRGMASGTSLHQLLVQSHQRSLNEMAGGAGGGDNQLARWFSPELLARAQAGKLPSVHVPNALSLEDLERHHHSPAPPVRN